MFTDSAETLPARQLVHLMRHLGHLTPRPWPDRPRRAVIGAPQQDSYHPDQEQTTQRDRIVADGYGGIVWRGTGESDHSRLL